VILDEMASMESVKSIAILGSGALVDIPVESLLGSVEEIHLYDLVHPRVVRKRYKNDPRVHVHAVDITGIIDAIYTVPRKLPMPPEVFSFLPPVDCVISANLLSQLPLIPLKWLRKSGQHTEDDLQDWKRALQKAHLHALNAGSYRYMLISDLRSALFDQTGTELETIELLNLCDVPPPKQTWEWLLCPTGEHEKGQTIVRNVGFWR
jgi:hypothetical protein